MQDQPAEPTLDPENLRANLRRIFDSGVNQTRIAKAAGLHRVHVARILAGSIENPGISAVASLAGALQIPLETLLQADPPDADLRISPKTFPIAIDKTVTHRVQ
ncbi:hypothetical protein CMI37_14325 [Candidatus Pacearchaeota archaeon]|nr:hypothetical protein [Candidatus Pacearchaeota archaeon]|tara:strand:+ start:2262 stop:2573 length:312 start_codon:yes stop_codon:yes gene_type:complete